MSEKLESSREELTALRVKQMKEQTSLEFSRYKQDCRKKSLDMAERCYQLEWTRWELRKDVEEPSLISLANKYYEWLISIPE